MNDTTIRIGSNEISLSHITQTPATRRRYLKACHNHGDTVFCLCRQEPIALGVALREGHTYYLYPLHKNDGTRHALACPLFRYPRAADSDASSQGVLEISDDKIIISLALPLYQQAPSNKSLAHSSKVYELGASTQGAGRGKLLTLLEVLWFQAGFNTWRPWFNKKRSYWSICSRIHEAVGKIFLGKEALEKLFYMPPPFSKANLSKNDNDFSDYTDKLTRADGKKYYGFVAGLIRDIRICNNGAVILYLKHHNQAWWITQAKWAAWQLKWFRRAPLDNILTSSFFLIMQVERKKGANGVWLSVIDIAVMRLADEVSYIPVDSSHELRLAKLLVDNNRQFRKPLSIEGYQKYLPDFILEDTKDQTFLEVLGMMTDEDYALHTADKKTFYEEINQAAWFWDAERQKDIPSLPGADLVQ